MTAIEDHARSIFLAALERAQDQWPALLNEACGGDADLRARVEQLLQAHQTMGSIHGDHGIGGVAAPAATLESSLREAPGTVIGAYKLLEQIGEGGFGVVFLADQTQPVRRKVALKVLKPGMDSRQVLARFEAERQALAIMDHPNIAKVFDGGMTDSGRPYFVMELVKGEPITEYCDRSQLAPRQRLELFAQVCHAVQHAHQKGIIHRDLKPTNVLVAVHDTTPVVKVIDFGVAKALGQELTEKTLFTGFAQLVGTPLYMSPEQAGHSALDVDTRSDIYSLGVLLYELLTGTTPFDKERFRKAAQDEIRRIIREEEPPKPSTRLSESKASLASVSAQRHMEPARLTKLVRGELDWIVMKALEKDRNRRYETASGFAADVQRYLQDDTVLACPPSGLYKLRKFARRNKTAVATAAALVLAVATVAGTIGWAARDRGARREAAERQAELALLDATGFIGQTHWPEALEALKRAEGFVAGVSTSESLLRRTGALRRDVDMAAKLEDIWLRRYESDEPSREWAGRKLQAERVDREFTQAFGTFGIDVQTLDPKEAAQRIRSSTISLQLATALDGWGSVSAWDPAGVRKRKQFDLVARHADPDPVRNRLRDAVLERGPGFKNRLETLAGSEEVLAVPITVERLGARLAPLDRDKAVAVLRNAQQRHPGNFHITYALATSLTLLQPPQTDEAVRFFTAAVAIRPRNLVARRALADALVTKKAYDEGISVLRAVVTINPHDAMGHYQIGAAYGRKGDAATEARAAYLTAVPELRRLLRANPEDAQAHHLLGHALEACGQTDEAIAELRLAVAGGQTGTVRCLGSALVNSGAIDEGIAAFEGAIAADPDNPENARAHLAIGAILCDDRHQPDAAIVHFKEALRLEPDDPVAHQHFGVALGAQGKLDEAIVCFRKAIELDPKYADAYTNLADRLTAQGKLDEAIACARKAIVLESRSAAPHVTLGYVLRAQGKLDEAVAAYRIAIELNPKYAEAHNDLGSALKRQGKLEEAIACYRKAIELNPKLAPPHRNLGNELQRQGKPDEAIAAYRTAIELDPKNLRVHIDLGTALYAQRNLDDSIVAYRKAIALDPKWVSAHYGLALALQAHGKLDEAIASYGKAIELDPKYANAHYGLGAALAGQKKLDQAIAAYLNAIDLDPNFANAHYALGLALKDQGKLDDAIAAYRRAITLDPKLARAYRDLGNALGKRGWELANCPDPKLRDPTRALAASKEAVEFASQSSLVWQYLGWVQYRAGNWKASIEALEKSCNLQKGGDSGQWIMMSLAHGRLANEKELPQQDRERHKTEARRWYDQAVKLIDPLGAGGDGLTQAIRDLRLEAAELLEVKEQQK